jgi:hypothetical protein
MTHIGQSDIIDETQYLINQEPIKLPSITDIFGKFGLFLSLVSFVSTICISAFKPLVSPVAAFAFISATTYGSAIYFIILFICIAFSDKAFDFSEETFNIILEWIHTNNDDQIFKLSNYKYRLWNSNIAEFFFSSVAFTIVMLEFVNMSQYTTTYFIYCIYLLHFISHMFYTIMNIFSLFLTTISGDESYLCFLFLPRMKPDNQGRCCLIVGDNNNNLKKIISNNINDIGFRESLLYALILPIGSFIIVIFFLLVILSCHVSGYVLWDNSNNCTESLVYF